MLPEGIPYSLSSHSGDGRATLKDNSQHTSIHMFDEVDILSEVRPAPLFWETKEAGSCGEQLALSDMSMVGSEGNQTRRCRDDCGFLRADQGGLFPLTEEQNLDEQLAGELSQD